MLRILPQAFHVKVFSLLVRYKVNGLETLGDLPPQGRAAVLNAAAGRFMGCFVQYSASLYRKSPLFAVLCKMCRKVQK